ncbi:MFS transporter [Streptomyces sp. AcH 505]|uniref:MFS transporter n=1 Tax=unclassified Streptomyces TaxID=2593676 RepID=UPI000591D39B|nr:MFS transporter [Streptomyces sp. NBC_00370]KIF71373.1 MFS transporter [Streptomyces sp. AcH 505]
MTDTPTQAGAPATGARGGTAAPFAALLLAVLSFSLMQTMVVPALPDLQREFDASTTSVSWVLSSFLLTASVATALLGRVGDMFGKRRVLIASLGVFAAGTLLAALSNSLPLLIAARAVQGVGSAAFPLAFGIVRDQFPRERVPVAIGLISSTFGIGFGVGLVIPGPIVDALNWHWIFWLGLVVILLGIAAVAAFIQESALRSPGRIDWTGVVLLSAGVVALLLAISEGKSWGWASGGVIGLFVGAVVLLVVFVYVETKVREPLIDIELLRRPAVLTSHITALIIGFGMYGAFTLVPLLAQTPSKVGYGFDASVTESGLFMVPMAVTMLIASPLAGRIGAAVGWKLPLVLACLIGVVGFVIYAGAHDTEWAMYAGSAVLGIGVGFAFAALANLVVSAVDRSQTGEATGINTIMRTIGGSLGAQIAASLVASKTIAGTRIPAESGYTTAFVMSAIALGVATLAALAGPGRLWRKVAAAPAPTPASAPSDGRTAA